MSNITTYLVSASLILLVIRQTCEHPPDARSLATPVLAVAAAAVMFLHSVPAGGSDLALEAAGVAAGAAMGAIGGLATKLRLSADGRPPGRAGWLAASTWVGGVGARLALAIAASNGAGPAIARFSVAHHISGSAAWVAALVMMALTDLLTQLVVIYLHGRRPRRPRPASRQPPAPDTGIRGGPSSWRPRNMVHPGAPDGGEACPGPGWRKRVPEPSRHACRPCLNPWPLLLHRGMSGHSHDRTAMHKYSARTAACRTDRGTRQAVDIAQAH